MKRLFASTLVLGLLSSTAMAGLAERPLRHLRLGSEVRFAVDAFQFDPTTSIYFQGGKKVTISLERNKPYCHVRFLRAPLGERIATGSVREVRGSFTTSKDGGFLTYLELSSKDIDGTITCRRPIDTDFTESSVADFDLAFGRAVQFGRVSFDPEAETPDFPLTLKRLRSGLYLEVATAFPAPARKDENAQTWYLQGRRFVAQPRHDEPYCMVAVLGAAAANPFTKGTKLEFGDPSGGYTKNGVLSPGFTIVGDLKHPKATLRYLCSSAQFDPPNYTEVSNATWGLVNWVNPF